LINRYLWGDRVDQQLARVDLGPATPYWTLQDRLGSIRDVINISGAVVDDIKYDAFGNITAETDATHRGWYAYTGREYDTETNLQYNHARWYDATMGRWITQDPLGFDAGDSNLYRYVNNAPTNATDPSGLQQPVNLQALRKEFKDDEAKILELRKELEDQSKKIRPSMLPLSNAAKAYYEALENPKKRDVNKTFQSFQDKWTKLQENYAPFNIDAAEIHKIREDMWAKMCPLPFAERFAVLVGYLDDAIFVRDEYVPIWQDFETVSGEVTKLYLARFAPKNTVADFDRGLPPPPDIQQGKVYGITTGLRGLRNQIKNVADEWVQSVEILRKEFFSQLPGETR
jgi:RHS repeat-associated protein